MLCKYVVANVAFCHWTGKRDNAGHEAATINKTGIIVSYFFFFFFISLHGNFQTIFLWTCKWLFKWRLYPALSHVLGCRRNKATRLKGSLWFLTLNCEEWRTEKAINTSISVRILSRHWVTKNKSTQGPLNHWRSHIVTAAFYIRINGV